MVASFVLAGGEIGIAFWMRGDVGAMRQLECLETVYLRVVVSNIVLHPSHDALASNS